MIKPIVKLKRLSNFIEKNKIVKAVGFAKKKYNDIWMRKFDADINGVDRLY